MASDSGVPIQKLRRKPSTSENEYAIVANMRCTDARLALTSTVSLVVVFRPSAPECCVSRTARVCFILYQHCV